MNKKIKVLIIGEHSYIGTNCKNWLEKKYENEYIVDVISGRSNKYNEISFIGYDVILHMSAIINASQEEKTEEMFYKINTELPINICKKAKKEGVKQFIFMSTMAVYGQIGETRKKVIIDKNTKLAPVSLYGKSKLEAENILKTFQDSDFAVCIIRAPFVYGKDALGNFLKLKKKAKKVLVFPLINNKRSLIYISNLCEFIRLIIDEQKEGVFCPQNIEYASTSSLIKEMSEIMNRKVFFSRALGKIVLLFNNSVKARKSFGNLVYDKEISLLDGKMNYCICDYKTSIKESLEGE